MDMCTLLAWRATNQENYRDVCRELRSSLERLLRDFVPSPAELLSLLTRNRALLSGELAVCYILRDAALSPQSLDIFVGSVWFDNFIDSFGTSPQLSGYQVRWSMIDHEQPRVASRHVATSLQLSLSTGRLLAIHAAASPSACHAIACSPSSLGTTFITEFSFATAYPRLIFSRRAIVSWSALAECSDLELDMYQRLEDAGFSLEEDPVAWNEYSGESDSRVQSSPLECLRSQYLCPQQGRYFGDDGSMVCFMDPLNTDFSRLKEKCIPPYGVMAVWRLPSRVFCDARCDEYDDILAPGVMATSIMFEDETFKANDEQRLTRGACLGHGASLGLRGRGRSMTL